MQEYLELVRYVLESGAKKTDRTGTGTLSLFGLQTRYDLRKGFPLLTTKKVLFDAVVRELLWFVRGSTNIYDDLAQHTPIWNAWADAQGELGPIYGYQWRKWPQYTLDERTGQYTQGHIDQLQQVIETIKRDPHSRRLIVSAWNVADLDKMALPPCHLLMQFYVIDNRLDLQVYQRSADLALGVPFNIASYALLLMMVAQECALQPGVFMHTLGDAHIYLNHIEGLTRQLQRQPYPLPRLTLAPKPFFDLTFAGHYPARLCAPSVYQISYCRMTSVPWRKEEAWISWVTSFPKSCGHRDENPNRRGYMQRICIFCGSQIGTNGLYRQAATALGQLLVRHGYGLVYGGGHVGLMGVIADAVLESGGEVIGVIPESMVARELAHTGLTQLQVVPVMHARKARMAELADAFIALPGGYGTFEELFEVITWAQLGMHRKPIGLLNVAGYFNALKALVDQAIIEGFIRAEHRHLLTMADDASTLLEMLNLKEGQET